MLNLNVGAGGYVIQNFISLDIYSSHYYKSKEEFLQERTEYDMSEDKPLPYKSDSVDNIYTSHVIEHCDDLMVFRFLQESLRVLKPKGVLRTACPDFRFLYDVMQAPSDWYRAYIKLKFRCTKTFELFEPPTAEDYLIHTGATARCRFYKNRSTNIIVPDEIKTLEYHDLLGFLKAGLSYRREFPGDHVNAWDYERISNMGKRVGFSRMIQSKKNASVSHIMRGREFDNTTPETSLYVDFIK